MGTVNFERKQDCFKKTEHVKTMLLWGDTDAVPNPWITVLIPTYRRTEFLKQALSSVLKQFHTKFFWDIIVLDNEPYDGKPNDNEKFIKKWNNKRVLYYRNSEHLAPGDNFNRGILLARGEWVTMLHDDDILVYSALQYLGKAISYCETLHGKKLGCIYSSEKSFRYNLLTEQSNIDLEEANAEISFGSVNFNLLPIKRNRPLLTWSIGAGIPSCGATFNRLVFIQNGGFDEELGVCADQFLCFNLEKKYRVYKTLQTLGFRRWGENLSSDDEIILDVAKNQYDFRQYLFHKNFINRIIGFFLENSQNKNFVEAYTDMIERNCGIKIKKTLLTSVCPKMPIRLMYFISWVIKFIYEKLSFKEAKKIGTNMRKYF